MTFEPPEEAPRSSRAPAADATAATSRALLALWAREGKWAEIAISGFSMSPLIPDGSRLTIRFGRQGLTAGDVVLYATETRLIAHRVLRLGRRGKRWGYLKVKGDPVRSGEAAWIPVEDVLGRVVAARAPAGAAILLNTPSARMANRIAGAISGAGSTIEGRARRVVGAARKLTVTPAMLSLLKPIYAIGSRGRHREAGLLLTAEERFLMAAARVRMSPEDERRLEIQMRKEVPWGRLPSAAAGLGLAPLLYRNLNRHPFRERVPRAALAALGRNAHGSACQMGIQLDALDAILDEVSRDGITPVLLKGAALALSLYEQPALRPMQDLDILVAPGEVEATVAALGRAGFRAVAASRTPAFYAAHHHTVPMIGRSGRVIVEIHRGLVPPEDGLVIDPAPFVARSQRIEARGRSYRVLSREDQMVHACLHLSYCDRFVGRLRDLIDVHAIVEIEAARLDWGIVVGATHQPEVHRSLLSSLDLARRLLGTPVPREVMHELRRGAGWDPVAERLLRTVARASLFVGGPSEGILPGASARFFCGTLIRRSRWGARLRDLAHLFAQA